MIFKEESLTVTRATWLLGTSTKNRDVKKGTVDKYARDMMAGKWIPSPQPIVVRWVDEDHTELQLEDGQHRCLAIREAARLLGTPAFTIPVVIAYLEPGEPDTFKVLDSGISRSFADLLKIEGYSNNAALAAITRKVWDWDTGQPWMPSRQPSKEELFDTLTSEKDELLEAAAYASRWRVPHTDVLYPSPAAFCRFLFRNRVMIRTRDGYARSNEDTSEDAEWFMQHIGDGTDLSETSPLYAFRFWRIHGAGTATPRGKSNNTLLLAVIKTWNSHRSGESVRRYVPPRFTVNNESFPKPL